MAEDVEAQAVPACSAQEADLRVPDRVVRDAGMDEEERGLCIRGLGSSSASVEHVNFEKAVSGAAEDLTCLAAISCFQYKPPCSISRVPSRMCCCAAIMKPSNSSGSRKRRRRWSVQIHPWAKIGGLGIRQQRRVRIRRYATRRRGALQTSPGVGGAGEKLAGGEVDQLDNAEDLKAWEGRRPSRQSLSMHFQTLSCISSISVAVAP